MKNTSMRYKGYTFHHNPATLNVTHNRNLKEKQIPFYLSVLQDYGRCAMVVTGQGELYGEDCFEQYQRLFALYSQKNSGALSVPGINPFMANFTYLAMISEPEDNLIKYKFTFTEDMQASFPVNSTDSNIHISEQGESLWDISFKYSIPVETLIELNNFIKRPDALEAGSRVTLR